MKLIPNWRVVLRHAWSVRLILLAGILSGVEAILPFAPGLVPVEQTTLAIITFAVVAAAMISRFIAQQSVSGDEP